MSRKPCPALWKTPVISSDGKLTLCCADISLESVVGDLNSEDYHHCWIHGKEITYYRLLHLLGDQDRIPQCRDCGGLNWRQISTDEIHDYLDQIDRRLFRAVLERIINERNGAKTTRESGQSKFTSFLHKPWLRENWWLTLVLSGKCNLSCPNCSQRVRDIQGEHMDFALLKKMMAEFRGAGLRFNSITPFYRGESLFHPQFTEMLRFMTQNRDLFGFYTLHTNGTHLTRSVSDALLDAYSQMPYGELYFSIDAATEATYNKVRPGGDFTQTIENIQYFVDEKARRKQRYPYLVFQFIVQQDNVHEAKLFLEFWSRFLSEKGVSFTVNQDQNRLLDLHQHQDNIIYFRRIETTPEEQEKNHQLQQQVYREIQND